jgi:dCTP diphosphatase
MSSLAVETQLAATFHDFARSIPPTTTSPRQTIFKLISQIGGLSASFFNAFASSSDASLDSWIPPGAELQLSTIFITFLTLSNAMKLDLGEQMVEKIKLNARKYPAELCRGLAGSYTNYSSTTGYTKDQATQSSVAVEQEQPAVAEGGEEKFLNPVYSGLNIRDIREEVRSFAKARQWDQFHTPRNVLLALVGELGELAEIFQWQGDSPESSSQAEGGEEDDDKILKNREKLKKQLEHVGQELADCSIYLIRLADLCHIDLEGGVDAIIKETLAEGK